MQMIQVKIHGEIFEGDFLNPIVAEKYEQAIEKAQKKASEDVKGESGSAGLRRQCNAISECIDTVLGAGSAERLMPEGADLLTCLDIFEELCYMNERQVTPLLQKRILKYSAQRAARNGKSAD